MQDPYYLLFQNMWAARNSAYARRYFHVSERGLLYSFREM